MKKPQKTATSLPTSLTQTLRVLLESWYLLQFNSEAEKTESKLKADILHRYYDLTKNRQTLFLHAELTRKIQTISASLAHISEEASNDARKRMTNLRSFLGDLGCDEENEASSWFTLLSQEVENFPDVVMCLPDAESRRHVAYMALTIACRSLLLDDPSETILKLLSLARESFPSSDGFVYFHDLRQDWYNDQLSAESLLSLRFFREFEEFVRKDMVVHKLRFFKEFLLETPMNSSDVHLFTHPWIDLEKMLESDGQPKCFDALVAAASAGYSLKTLDHIQGSELLQELVLDGSTTYTEKELQELSGSSRRLKSVSRL